MLQIQAGLFPPVWVPLSRVHVGEVLNYVLFHVLHGDVLHVQHIYTVSLSMAAVAQTYEVMRRIGAAFPSVYVVMNLQVLCAVTQGTAVSIAAVDCLSLFIG